MFRRPVRRRNHADDPPLKLLTRTGPVSATVGSGMGRNELRGLVRDLSDAKTHFVRERPTYQNGETRVAQIHAAEALHPHPGPCINQALTYHLRSHVVAIHQPAFP